MDKGIGLNSIAVAVSSYQFRSGTLIGVVQRALHAHDLAPGMLEIELTESVLMRESDIVCQQITALRKIGVRVSLDDFGTGYSSLSYLSKFEFDKIKIDQSFVRNVPQERRSEAIALATVALAKSLEMDVIAGGGKRRATALAGRDWLRQGAGLPHLQASSGGPARGALSRFDTINQCRVLNR